ncbi:putative Serine/threonine protein kinase [Streptomyces misionensis JCM 4497]
MAGARRGAAPDGRRQGVDRGALRTRQRAGRAAGPHPGRGAGRRAHQPLRRRHRARRPRTRRPSLDRDGAGRGQLAGRRGQGAGARGAPGGGPHRDVGAAGAARGALRRCAAPGRQAWQRSPRPGRPGAAHRLRHRPDRGRLHHHPHRRGRRLGRLPRARAGARPRPRPRLRPVGARRHAVHGGRGALAVPPHLPAEHHAGGRRGERRGAAARRGARPGHRRAAAQGSGPAAGRGGGRADARRGRGGPAAAQRPGVRADPGLGPERAGLGRVRAGYGYARDRSGCAGSRSGRARHRGTGRRHRGVRLRHEHPWARRRFRGPRLRSRGRRGDARGTHDGGPGAGAHRRAAGASAAPAADARARRRRRGRARRRCGGGLPAVERRAERRRDVRRSRPGADLLGEPRRPAGPGRHRPGQLGDPPRPAGLQHLPAQGLEAPGLRHQRPAEADRLHPGRRQALRPHIHRLLTGLRRPLRAPGGPGAAAATAGRLPTRHPEAERLPRPQGLDVGVHLDRVGEGPALCAGPPARRRGDVLRPGGRRVRHLHVRPRRRLAQDRQAVQVGPPELAAAEPDQLTASTPNGCALRLKRLKTSR